MDPRGNVQHIARLQLYVACLVTLYQQRVKIKVSEYLALALQRNMAHGACPRGTTAQKNRIHQSVERAHCVLARLARLACHVHLDGMNLTHVDA